MQASEYYKHSYIVDLIIFKISETQISKMNILN